MNEAPLESGQPSLVDRFLSLFANVRPGEGLTALLLMTNIFTVLTAYYIIKPVREALILGEAGAEIKSYSSGIQAALFLVIIPLYGMLASRVNRVWLINGVNAFFVSNLIIFYVLGKSGVELGIPFFLWVGLFNVLIIAQFWAFANDVYAQKKGERLFGVIGIGASVGAIFGAWIAGKLFEPLGAYPLMLVSAGLLVLCAALINWIHHREKHAASTSTEGKESTAETPLGKAGGFGLIMKSRYLLMIALLVLLTNWVNTTGEFILGKTVAETATAATADVPGDTEAKEAAAKTYIGEFYADFYFWVNLFGALVQMFLVSRIMQRLGVGSALFFLPVVALGSYTIMAVMPILSLIRGAKILENTLDYSIQNTTRHALFLPTSREAKYKAKAAIDGFFWRAGDSMSGVLVYAGTQAALSVRGFAAINAGLVIAWIAVAFIIFRYLRDDPSASTRIAA